MGRGYFWKRMTDEKKKTGWRGTIGGWTWVGAASPAGCPSNAWACGTCGTGVVAGGNGDGLIEPPPESLTLQFGLVRSVQVQMVHGTDFPLAVGVEEAFPVGFVVEEKGFFR